MKRILSLFLFAISIFVWGCANPGGGSGNSVSAGSGEITDPSNPGNQDIGNENLGNNPSEILNLNLSDVELKEIMKKFLDMGDNAQYYVQQETFHTYGGYGSFGTNEYSGVSEDKKRLVVASREHDVYKDRGIFSISENFDFVIENENYYVQPFVEDNQWPYEPPPAKCSDNRSLWVEHRNAMVLINNFAGNWNHLYTGSINCVNGMPETTIVSNRYFTTAPAFKSDVIPVYYPEEGDYSRLVLVVRIKFTDDFKEYFKKHYSDNDVYGKNSLKKECWQQSYRSYLWIDEVFSEGLKIFTVTLYIPNN